MKPHPQRIKTTLLLALTGFALAAAPADVDLDGTFETGGAPGTLVTKESPLNFPHVQVNPGNSIRLIDTPVREGKRAARFEAKRPGVAADWRRAEVVEKYGSELLRGPRERWYGGSFLLPDDYEWDDQPVIIFQMHENTTGKTGGTGPIFTLNIAGDKLGDMTLKKNTWYDFVLHARWTDKTDGFVTHWINGEKKSDRHNLKTSVLAGNKPPYAKWGIYKYGWRSKPKESSASRVVVIWDHCTVGATRAHVTPPLLKAP